MSSEGERRRYPRHDLYAHVELKGDKRLILSMRDISVAGVFLVAEGNDLSQFAVGSDQDLVILNPDDPALSVSVRARVVRRAPDGLALAWKAPETISDVSRR